MNNYTTKTTDINNGKGYWKYLKVEIFKDDEKIGEYVRNYSTLFNTFLPFEKDGKEYALYSKHYTATRIMSLPDCTDLGGEESSFSGFCPTDYYVPEICIPYPLPDETDPEPEYLHKDNKWRHIVEFKTGLKTFIYPTNKEHPQFNNKEYQVEYNLAKENYERLKQEWNSRHPYTDTSAPFGFVTGCRWGDDSSWKLEYLDLSEVEKGIIKRDDRFGYLELPTGIALKDAINTDFYDYDSPYIEIATAVRFNINGKKETN